METSRWRIVLFGDFNENVYTGCLGKRLDETDLIMTGQYLKTNASFTCLWKE